MANDPLSIVKRAPKWAWFTVAGVGVGAGAIHLFRNRTTAESETNSSSPSEDVAVTGNPNYVGGNTPVIVPSVMVSGPSADQSGTGLGDLQGMYLQANNEILDMFSSRVPDTYDRIYGPIAAQNLSLSDNIYSLLSQATSTLGGIAERASAGGAPPASAQGTYVDPAFAAAISRGDPNALAYVAAGAPYIDPAFAAAVAAGDPATLAFIRAHGG